MPRIRWNFMVVLGWLLCVSTLLADEAFGVPAAFLEPLRADGKALGALRDRATALGLQDEAARVEKLLELRGRKPAPAEVKLPENPEEKANVAAAFPKELEKVLRDRAEKWVSFGQGLAKEYPSLALEAYRAALDLDPENKKARKALGQEWSAESSSWVTQAEAMKAKGKVLFRGEWVEPAQMQKTRDAELAIFKDTFFKTHLISDDGGWRFAALPDINLAVHGSEEDLAALSGLLRSVCDKVYVRYFPKAQATAFSAIFFASEEEYLTLAKANRGTGGYFSERTLKSHIRAPQYIICHEMSHGYIRSHNSKGESGALPKWFDESAATFFESFDEGGGDVGLPYGGHLQNLSRLKADKKLLPLIQLMKVEQFYHVDLLTQGHTLMLFLHSRGVLPAFFERSLSGRCRPQELENLMGMKLSEIDKELQKFRDALPNMGKVEAGSFLTNVRGE